MIWQLLRTDQQTTSRGYLLSTAEDYFLIQDLQSNTILQTFPVHSFVLDTAKYRNEVFSKIANMLYLPYSPRTIYYDQAASDLIDELCHGNRLLF